MTTSARAYTTLRDGILSAHHRLADPVDAMDLKHVLGEIDTDRANLRHGWFLHLGQ